MKAYEADLQLEKTPSPKAWEYSFRALTGHKTCCAVSSPEFIGEFYLRIRSILKIRWRKKLTEHVALMVCLEKQVSTRGRRHSVDVLPGMRI